MSNKATATDPATEFDEYGTELHKDARVWKVYVNETDKYDTELAREWNDSTEVILIFAALFSAISAAFLIESSKLLQEDPAETSKQTLATMSQTLLIIANGSQLSGLIGPSPPVGATVRFAPPYAAVCTNVLWFLSLSLSLATSFIAMMAKDWCHTFLSGRTGHPFSQACRRQQKWDMIERWKMRELLSLLPSLMHIALLLFAVGLSIHLWSVHIVVAVPVIIVTSSAFGFYMLASAGAILFEYFPYPTNVSRLWRGGGIVQRSFEYVSWLPLAIASYPPFQILFVCAFYALVGVIDITYWSISFGLSRARIPLRLMRTHLDSWNRSIRENNSVLLQVVVVPPLSFMRLFVCNSVDKVIEWLLNIPTWWYPAIGSTCRSIITSCLASVHTWRDLNAKSASPGHDRVSAENKAIGRALGWLIVNCEVPQSVDIALQAIAGGPNRISIEPLVDCNATLEIFRRLASSNFHRGWTTQADTVVSLYTRALRFLSDSVAVARTKQWNVDSLEGLIWDLHLEAEMGVEALIVTGNFELSQPNLEALRIGSTAASASLKILNQDSPIHGDPVFDSIDKLLSCHFGGGQTLHDAALLSLINAAAVLYLVAPEKSTLSLSYLEISESFCRSPTLQAGLMVTSLLWSMLLPRLDPQGPDRKYWFGEAIRGFIEMYSQDQVALKMVVTFGLQALLTGQATSYIEAIDSQVQEIALNSVASGLRDFYDDLRHTISGDILLETQEDVMLCYLRVLRDIDSLLPIGPPSSCVPFFALPVVNDIWMLPYESLIKLNGELVNTCRFPKISIMLIWVLEKLDIIPQIETRLENSSSPRFVETSQLWLLFTLYLYPPDNMAEEWERLEVQLQRYDKNSSWSAADHHRRLGEQLEEGMIWNRPRRHVAQPVEFIWPARVMECVYQFRNAEVPERIRKHLNNVPKEHRGLASFTSWRPGTGAPAAEEASAETLVDDVHTTTDSIQSTHDQHLTEIYDTAMGVEITEGDTGVAELRDVVGKSGDGGGTRPRSKEENPRDGTSSDQQEAESKDNARVWILEGKKDQVIRAAGWGIVPQRVEDEGREPHVAVDMRTCNGR